jgi:phosphoglycerate kinase
MAIFDIGSETRRAFFRTITDAKTIFWNGPLGVAEKPPFAVGTRRVAEAVAMANVLTATAGGTRADRPRPRRTDD